MQFFIAFWNVPHNALTKKNLPTLRKVGLLLFQLHFFQFLELIVPYKHLQNGGIHNKKSFWQIIQISIWWYLLVQGTCSTMQNGFKNMFNHQSSLWILILKVLCSVLWTQFCTQHAFLAFVVPGSIQFHTYPSY